DYDEKTRGRSSSSVVTQSGDQTTIRDRKRELGMVTTGTETTDGELTNRKETVKGAGFGVGGNVVGAQYGKSDSTKIGENIGVTHSKNLTGGINSEGKLNIGGERKQVVQHGVKPDGTPITTTKATTGGITVDPHSIGGNLAQSYTTKSGKEVTGGASFT